MHHGLGALAALGLLAAGQPVAAAPACSGVVFDDRDGDGAQGPAEPGRAGVRVVGGGAATTTDARGGFTLPAAPGSIVWARTPADARSAPTWGVVSPDGEVRLALRPAPPAGPLTFAVAADSHHDLIPADGWDDAALGLALAQVRAAAPAARFVALLGDLSQSAFADELAEVDQATRATGLPLVPVPGNHDWYDLGVAYAARFGPDQYSLEVPGARVLVWNGNLDDAAIAAFVAAELADAPTGMVIALGHQSPSDALAATMAQLGVDALLTGHWHAARGLPRAPGLREWGVPPLTMGGVDGSAAGFAVADLTADGLAVRREATTVEPTLALLAPRPGACAGAELLVEARTPGAQAAVTARLDCGAPVVLTRRRGGAFGMALPPGLAPGRHRLELRRDDDATSAQVTTIEVCGDGAARAAWSRDLGGPLAGGPVRAGDLALVAIGGPGEAAPALVAIDLATGALRWRRALPAVVRGPAAVAGDLVVVLRDDGVVAAVALTDGAPRWTYDLGAGLPRNAASAWAAPTIAGERVVVAVQGRLVVLGLADGAPRLTLTPPVAFPWLGTRAAIAVHDDVALVVRNRSEGLWAVDLRDGATRWLATGPDTIAIDATPALVTIDGEPRVVTVNAAGDVVARDLATGTVRWRTATVRGGFEWGYVAPGPLLIDGDQVVVGTRWGELVALALRDGAARFRVAAPAPAAVNTTPYRPRTRGFPDGAVRSAAALVALDAAGTLRWLDPTTGATQATTALGTPTQGAPLVVPGGLVIASVDGILWRLPDAPPPPELAPPGCPAPPARPPWRGLGLGVGITLVVAGLVAGLVRRRRQ